MDLKQYCNTERDEGQIFFSIHKHKTKRTANMNILLSKGLCHRTHIILKTIMSCHYVIMQQIKKIAPLHFDKQ